MNDPYLIVVPRVDIDTVYDVYIDGIKQQTYTFTKKSEEYSYKRITIDVKKGPIKIQTDLCWAMYPTDDGNYFPWVQEQFCDWFVGINCEPNKWYKDPIKLEFYHIYMQGPSYFKGNIPIYNYEPILSVDPKKKNKKTTQLKKVLDLWQ